MYIIYTMYNTNISPYQTEDEYISQLCPLYGEKIETRRDINDFENRIMNSNKTVIIMNYIP